MEKIKAIETKYKNYRFRSRLEARWALFFDKMGIRYEYEPEGFSLIYGIRYLPDFALYNVKWRGIGAEHYIGKKSTPIYVEVKGVDNYNDIKLDDRVKIEEFSKFYPLLILGNIPMTAWEAMDPHSGIFNYSLLDGDNYPCFFSEHNGEIWLAGPDHEEFHPGLNDRALSIARQARFESEPEPEPPF